MERTVIFEDKEIVYTLTYKKVKNLNLRVKADQSVWVSAPKGVGAWRVDAFVRGKGAFILSALERFEKTSKPAGGERRYATGERFHFLGGELRLQVLASSKEQVRSDGTCLYLMVKDPEDRERKKRLLEKWLKEQRIFVFTKTAKEIHKKFLRYKVEFPQIQIRDMSTRWGSCRPGKGAITLNARLIETPLICLEYVAAHEFCHFIHPDHSRNFYALLQDVMPDWKERKRILEASPCETW